MNIDHLVHRGHVALDDAAEPQLSSCAPSTPSAKSPGRATPRRQPPALDLAPEPVHAFALERRAIRTVDWFSRLNSVRWSCCRCAWEGGGCFSACYDTSRPERYTGRADQA